MFVCLVVICHISVFYFHLKLLIWVGGLLKVREVKGSEEDCRFDPRTGVVNVKESCTCSSFINAAGVSWSKT